MSSRYTVALNATVYYAEIHSDYPLNTPVFSIRVYVSSTVGLLDLLISLSQTGEINNLFEFEGGDNDRITINIDNLVPVGGDHYVFDTSINLVQEPEFEEDEYPVNLDIDVGLVGLYSPDVAVQELSIAMGQILNTPGEPYRIVICWHSTCK